MQGGLCTVMFSWRRPPGAHLLLSPVVGRPSVSTACAVPAEGADALPAVTLDCVARSGAILDAGAAEAPLGRAVPDEPAVGAAAAGSERWFDAAGVRAPTSRAA